MESVTTVYVDPTGDDRNAGPTPALPRNAGLVFTDPGVRCEDGRIAFADPEAARRLGIRALDVSGAGCGRE